MTVLKNRACNVFVFIYSFIYLFIYVWYLRFSDNQQWIQVNFGHPERIAGVLTMGRADADQWVESFVLETSLDGKHWYQYTDANSAKSPTVFPANFDRNTPVRTMLDREIDAKFVRISPRSWHNAIALRFEVLSCYGPVLLQTTLVPPLHSGGVPTAQPHLGSDQTPTAQPPISGTEVPTAAPGIFLVNCPY